MMHFLNLRNCWDEFKAILKKSSGLIHFVGIDINHDDLFLVNVSNCKRAEFLGIFDDEILCNHPTIHDVLYDSTDSVDSSLSMGCCQKVPRCLQAMILFKVEKIQQVESINKM